MLMAHRPRSNSGVPPRGMPVHGWQECEVADAVIEAFSAFFSSAALVKLNDPVRRVVLSITITLLWAMAC